MVLVGPLNLLAGSRAASFEKQERGIGVFASGGHQRNDLLDFQKRIIFSR